MEKTWENNRTQGKLVPLTSNKTSDTVNATYLLEVIVPAGEVSSRQHMGVFAQITR